MDLRWQAVQARDARADGSFVYAVRTTGVYCRPSCPSRRARRENVSFHETPSLAEAAGFRPCLRCLPRERPASERRAALVARLCAAMERRPLPLRELARLAGLSPFHTQRMFRELLGVTPQKYAAQLRAERLRRELGGGAAVTGAMLDAGFSSAGSFHGAARAALGMSPSRYRRGGERERIRFAAGTCSLGQVVVAATDAGVCAILLGDDPAELVEDLQRRFARAELVGGDATFEGTVALVVGLVERPWLPAAIPLDVRGTAFQQRVWQALARIPPGTTATYAEVAGAIGAPRSVRAVAQACGANPVAVAIPCHRVVRTGGGLSGYRWGVERKRELLSREAVR